MLDYLLKSSACMVAFLMFYQFLMEKENMHQFKRFFLLGALITSLIIPGLVFIEYVEATPQHVPTTTSIFTDQEIPVAAEPVTDMDVVDWPLLLWTIYGLGFLVFGFRFVKHLYQILNRIRTNPKLKEQFITRVLLRKQMPPHTFFNYIFLNKEELEKNSIPHEVILHEETHAKQYHSLDVLFIELLQVVFWFNPLIFLFKKNIKLNHEFLADSAVIEQKIPTKKYQNTLLSYLSSANENKYQSVKMANAITYSSTRAERSRSIKKRFTVMKKQRSKKSVILRSFLLAPLVAILLVGFSTKKEIMKTADNPMEESNLTARSLSIEILGNGTYLIEKNVANKSNFIKTINTFNSDLTPEVRNRMVNVHLSSSSEIPNEEVWFIYNSLLEYGFYRIVAPNQEINREKGNTPFAIENQNHGASSEELIAYRALAKKYNAVPMKERIIPLNELRTLETIYRRMTIDQKKKAEPFPECLPNHQELSQSEYLRLMLKKRATFYYNGKKITGTEALQIIERQPVNIFTPEENNGNSKVYLTFETLEEFTNGLQKGASREQMKEYNALAKKYNAMSRENMKVKIKEVERMKYIYGLMSDKQKADAEPFPEFPIPPEMPTFRSPPEVRELPAPPSPPTPPAPVDHIIEMAKKGATFYYEGKEVSSDRAIELIKSKKDLNIQTTKTNSKNPQVRISKSPFRN